MLIDVQAEADDFPPLILYQCEDTRVVRQVRGTDEQQPRGGVQLSVQCVGHLGAACDHVEDPVRFRAAEFRVAGLLAGAGSVYL